MLALSITVRFVQIKIRTFKVVIFNYLDEFRARKNDIK